MQVGKFQNLVSSTVHFWWFDGLMINVIKYVEFTVK